MPPGHKPSKVFLNNLYQVSVFEGPAKDGWPEILHLSIKTLRRTVIRDWRHLQRIKNEIVGHEWEAVELFPAESRLVDTANQYHLWCFKDPTYRFPFGFQERAVQEGDHDGVVQRPFAPDERPEDLRQNKPGDLKKRTDALRAAKGPNPFQKVVDLVEASRTFLDQNTVTNRAALRKALAPFTGEPDASSTDGDGPMCELPEGSPNEVGAEATGD